MRCSSFWKQYKPTFHEGRLDLSKPQPTEAVIAHYSAIVDDKRFSAHYRDFCARECARLKAESGQASHG